MIRDTVEIEQNNMFNETDLLVMNTFIDPSSENVPKDKAENYKRYFLEKKGAPAAIEITENQNQNQNIAIRPAKEVYVRRKRKIYFDSRFRDTTLYPDSSSYAGTFGRTFHNVISMKLTSMEFSNVQKVLSTSLNKLYWRNQEDIDLETPYPIYEAIIPAGSYTYSTFQTESTLIMNVIKRHNGEQNNDGTKAIFHYFIMDISLNTDYGAFTSIIAKPAPTNPITTVSGDTLVIFQFPNHGFKTGDTIYILGVRGIIGGVNSSSFNGAWTITVVNADSFTYNIFFVATGSVTGGGALVKAGELAAFQFMFGDYSDSCADLIGFRVENSNVNITNSDPFTSRIIPITNVIIGEMTKIVAPNHGLKPGDRVFINNVQVTPSFIHNGEFEVLFVPSPDVIVIDYYTEHLTDLTGAFLGIKFFEVTFPNHGFNSIIDIEQTDVNVVTITTLLPHGLITGDNIRIRFSNSIPNIDGYYKGINVIDIDQFQISNPVNPLTPSILPLTINFPGYSGILLSNHIVHFYNVSDFGGFSASDINAKIFNIREIIDKDNFIVEGIYGFSTSHATGGGSQVRFNSLLHGWDGIQSNSPGGILNKPVALSGDNYCYLCCPGLKFDNVASNGPVENIFAKLFITANPGVIIFNEYDTSELDFATPIENLSSILFEIRDTYGNLLSFSGLEYSFSVELTELLKVDENNDKDSRIAQILNVLPNSTVENEVWQNH